MRLSVLIASYNGENYIKEQISSIISQINFEDEIIVSDDGSTDSTIEIIRNFKDSRIKIIQGPRKGLIKNFENAINNSNGDVIIFSDQDDIWGSERINSLIKAFNNNADLVISKSIAVDSNLNPLKGILADPTFQRGLIRNLYKNTYIGATMAIKKSELMKALPFPNSIIMHDQWIGLNMELLNKNIQYEPSGILYHRRLESNVTYNKKQSLFKKINDRLVMGLLILRVMIKSLTKVDNSSE
ncbi:glycosyltransferase [Periweissella ghanensis]|uniref:UDP-Glc:alpha-D-GlcNAc-diphosphoundecaprenol beta-1,3-glucosyltransferase WfgD n=1 Tax=Periweissella ghanensis TaxID=467997 RepID=A0ABM8ZCH8_9LACO|nr:glycosyltransferase [Periweissella ghanensis]MCM0600252.1 glycosyltransferase [Periweissella ghanensis]CAH0419116.1 UDP-Glc:alpha-D-GlcNAc-diphosphoundecaprenol beta-1,3-glucosyltransferase WfgD [Periweissella ghanensis]